MADLQKARLRETFSWMYDKKYFQIPLKGSEGKCLKIPLLILSEFALQQNFFYSTQPLQEYTGSRFSDQKLLYQYLFTDSLSFDKKC